MGRGLKAIIASTAISLATLMTSSVAAQDIIDNNVLIETSKQNDRLWSLYNRDVYPGVVCIKKSFIQEEITMSDATYQRIIVPILKGGFGTGTVFEETQVDGKTEYYIYTNNHVSFIAKVFEGEEVFDGKLRIVKNGQDFYPYDDIELEIYAVHPDIDMAILRTKNAPKMHVARVTFEPLPRELDEDDMLFMGGFPLGLEKSKTKGNISSFNAFDSQAMPVPQDVYQVDIKADPGHSGSMVVTPYITKIDAKWHVVGAFYAGDKSTDTVRLISPMTDEARRFIKEKKSVPSKRPSLFSQIKNSVLDNIDPSQMYFLYGMAINIEKNENEYGLKIYEMNMERIVKHQYLNINFELVNGKANVVNMQYAYKDSVVDLGEGNEYDDIFTSSILNYCILRERGLELLSNPESTTEETRQAEYIVKLVDEWAENLGEDLEAFIYKFYKQGKIHEHFLF